MALQKQIVPINIAQGIDTKSDDKSLPLGKLVNLENMRYDELNKIKKKFGSTTLGTSVISGGTAISDPVRITTFKNELVLITKTRIYSYVPAASAWKDLGPMGSVSISSESVFANIESQSLPDCATVGNYICYVWEEGTSIILALVDKTTGAYILRDYEVATSSTNPQVYANTDSFLIFYFDGSNNLKKRIIDTATPYFVASAVTTASGVTTTDIGYKIVKRTDGSFILGYKLTSTSKVVLALLDEDGVPTASASSTDTVTQSFCLTFIDDGVTEQVLLFYMNSSNLKSELFDIPLSSVAVDTVDNTTLTVRNITAAYRSSDDRTYVFYEVDAADTYNAKIRNSYVEGGVASGTFGDFMLSVGIASEAFIGPDDEIYLTTVHESVLQPTYFLTRYIAYNTPFVAATFANYVAGGLTSRDNSYSHVTSIGSSKYIFANILKTKLTTSSGEILALDTVQATTFDFNNKNSITTIEMGENLLISGGCPYVYDGSSVVEFGFHLYPENLDNTTPVAGSPNPGAGTFLYKAVYEWTDTKGQTHRSAPSPAHSVTLGSGERCSISVPTLRVTEKDRTANSDISIVIYRTTAGGSIYYRITDVTDPVTNNTKLSSVSYLDDNTDASITSNEILYTQGGALENINIGSANVVSEYKNRAVFINLEDRSQVRYSKEQVVGESLQFNPLLGFRIDDANKAITAIGEMDQYMVLFTPNDIYIQSGQGPTDSGALNDFQTPQPIAGDVGCPYPQSVVKTPQGLMFKSKKGYYLLDRSLNTSYIGYPVEDFNSLTVSGAVLVRNENTVRFTHSDGSCLSYEYLVGQWAIYTGYTAVSACLWNDSFCYVDSTGEVFQETSSTYLVDSAAILGKIKTGWIKLGGLKGFQRLYNIMFTGKYYSAHGLTVKLYYDYSTSATDTFTYTASSDFDFEVRPTVQKCEAIQIEIIEINSVPTDGASFDLSGITLVVGVKPNSYRIKPTKRVDAD